MKKIYIYKTKVGGKPLYTKNPKQEHPLMHGEFPSELKLTKKNIIDYILWTQEEPCYKITELRKMTKEHLLKLL